MGNKNSKTNRCKKSRKKSTIKHARAGEDERVGQPAYCRRWGSRPVRRCQSDNPINYDLLQQCGVQQSLCPPTQRPTLGPPPNMMMQPPFNPRPCHCAQNNQEMPHPNMMIRPPFNPRPCHCAQNNQEMPHPIPCNCDQQTQPKQKMMTCCCVMPVPQSMPAPRSQSEPRRQSYSQPQPRQHSHSQPRNRREVHFFPNEDQSSQPRCSQSSITLNIDYRPCPHYSNSQRGSNRNSSYYPPRQYESDPSLNENDSIPSSCSCCSSNISDRNVTFADTRGPRRSCFRCFQRRKNRSPRYNPR